MIPYLRFYMAWTLPDTRTDEEIREQITKASLGWSTRNKVFEGQINKEDYIEVAIADAIRAKDVHLIIQKVAVDVDNIDTIFQEIEALPEFERWIEVLNEI